MKRARRICTELKNLPDPSTVAQPTGYPIFSAYLFVMKQQIRVVNDNSEGGFLESSLWTSS